ncbi:MAG: Glutathione-regulated potassium-efflux system protein KefC [Planctomycetes bacterium]|nr:Glutathione-regulated potassium-efflux system protein KefC [Planctomycetota bacterium]
MDALRRRLIGAAIALAATIVAGGFGYWIIGGGKWGFWESVYMAHISATTVGFGETLAGMDAMPAARVWSAVVILAGVAVFGFAAAMFTAWVVESDLRASFRRKAMRKHIDALQGHMIVCGVGSTGRHVVKEMIASRIPVVAIDVDAARLDALASEVHPAELLFLIGDASDDHVLDAAGVTRAKGLVAALPEDKDNLFVVVSAHNSNPQLRIISRGSDLRTAEKLRKAGAASVVSPNFIGGMRLAGEMIRPHVVEFLDEMLRDRDKALRVEEVTVPEGSPLAGRSLREANLRAHTEALVLAVRDQMRKYVYNPGAEFVIHAGTILIVLGHVDSVQRLRSYVETPVKT